MVVHSQGSDGCSGVDLTTPLGHETFKSSIDVRIFENLAQRVALCVRFEKDKLAFLSFLVFYAYLW